MTNLLLSLLANATVVSSGAIGSKSTTPANSNSDLSLDAYSRPYGVPLEFRGCYLPGRHLRGEISDILNCRTGA